MRVERGQSVAPDQLGQAEFLNDAHHDEFQPDQPRVQVDPFVAALQIGLEGAPAVHGPRQQRQREEQIDEIVERRDAFVARREQQHVDGAERGKGQPEHRAQVRDPGLDQQQRRHRDDDGEPGGDVVAAHCPQRAAGNGQERNGLIGPRPEHRHPDAQADDADDVAVPDVQRHAGRAVCDEAKAAKQRAAKEAQASKEFHGALRTAGIGIRP